MEQFELAIGRLLLFGVLISFVIVLTGGASYLIYHHADIVHYATFQGEPQNYKSILDIVVDAIHFSSLGWIQLGLLILVIVQVLRVGMTLWIFIKLRDNAFFFISLFIFFVLIYSLFWRV